MSELHKKTKEITELVFKSSRKAREETNAEPEPHLTQPITWPVECVVGPGLEGAIACESKIGYVNGLKGWLIYRGYDIFDLCAYSTYEEVSYLLLYGYLPTAVQLKAFKKNLIQCRNVPNTLRLLMSFSIEEMNPMAVLRLGTNLMRQEFTYIDRDGLVPKRGKVIGTDEDSIPMETVPRGEEHAIYEFKDSDPFKSKELSKFDLEPAIGYKSCYRLISGVATIAAAIVRIRQQKFPIDSDPELSHAANLIYMMTGKQPTPEEERIMDIALILHADHGINASTFAAMVVASTLSDMYFSVGSGIAALNGPLHGGANEQVLHMLREIGEVSNVKSWYKKSRKKKQKIMGFGHRVYKAYDPRARILRPLAKHLAKRNKESGRLFQVAKALEKEVISTLGVKKRIFPNVDFYSGIVYDSLGIPPEIFTPIFAVSRVSGWTSRIMEYLEKNRIFRPRAIYIGQFNKKYVSLEERTNKTR
ncbi:MAG: citrate/2-methylcitrate synthase [Candidatus Omnitrophica bacterium]|nr:citrate/2-methylcitrate synthase [Candidatus Omnitrophota bacterium]